MSKKSIGNKAERELIHMFWDKGWAAFRAAGSGSSRFPCPDLIAGNSLKKIAIEVKYISNNSKYFSKKEINDLKYFSYIFGCEPWIGIKFKTNGWFFFSIEDLKQTNLGFSISFKDTKLKGFSFEELIN